ncbi:Latrophilin/CL-1-like GPS domain protein [Ancylostoma duodenale]|uniref:Latrophilin/CL-1-like GPS domain protein n=1 Tax=Ancylostoma duodenale TaxID=51022 RepID=A0A0C2CWH6_9BILA|nr:Latrophilin/CL-1-like GPS domain protein [Ancylostoma duodenale]
MYMTIYRNRKLFIGSKQYSSYGSTTTLAQRSRSLPTAVKEDEAQSTEQEPPPSPCRRQIALSDESPVMSGTVLSNDKLLQPLHGHFRVTWWDPDALEWSTEDQCQTSIEGNIIVATCEHLTDFSLIVDAALNDPNVCDRALIGLGISVNTISIFSLTFLAFINLCG